MVAVALNAGFAALNTPFVNHLGYTSSFTSIPLPKHNVELIFSVENWNIEAIEAAWKPLPYKSERVRAL